MQAVGAGVLRRTLPKIVNLGAAFNQRLAIDLSDRLNCLLSSLQADERLKSPPRYTTEWDSLAMVQAR